MGWLLLAVLVCVALAVARVSRGSATIDPAGVVGLEGTAENTFSREGVVFVRGELWRATTMRGIVQKGERVKILEVRPGLLVVVERVEPPSNS